MTRIKYTENYKTNPAVCCRYINTFVKAINLNKKKEQAAINVIKHAIQICILLRNGKSYTSPEMQGHRLALWRAARARRILEERQTRLWISRAGISEVQSGVVDLQESVDRIQKDQQYFRIRLDGFEKVILSLNRQIYDLKTLLEKSVLNKAAWHIFSDAVRTSSILKKSAWINILQSWMAPRTSSVLNQPTVNKLFFRSSMASRTGIILNQHPELLCDLTGHAECPNSVHVN